ncbi:hypothetical protein [Azospirillum largimobile]
MDGATQPSMAAGATLHGGCAWQPSGSRRQREEPRPPTRIA